ncbi:MAG: hypothetical protein PUB19_07730 [Lachnospiraceae bacterium]|nr:hypothetical protein [Lachnospiraceae bacterium]
MRTKRITKTLALSLVLLMLMGNTAFAAEGEVAAPDVSVEEATEGYNVTDETMNALVEEVAEAPVDANDALVKATTAELLSGGTYTYTNAAQVSRLVQQGYACNQEVHKGPFSITKGVLTTKGWFGRVNNREVYVVALSGTDTDTENQTTDIWTDLLVGFEFDNKYIQNVKKAMLENIPAGSNIVVTGHSLGGMVAQQVASDSDLKNNYNILNTVTFGSPLINGFKREGTVKRLGDVRDVVPYLSLTTLTNIIWQSAGLNKEDGGYGSDIIAAHCESYNREDVWGAYDVTGTKNGGATLTLDYSTTAFYFSPVTITE